jgi:hypothetical protein
MLWQEGFKCCDRMVLNVVKGWFKMLWQDRIKCCDRMGLNVVKGWI